MVRVRRQRRRRRPHTVPGDEPNLTEVNTEEDNYVGWNPGKQLNLTLKLFVVGIKSFYKFCHLSISSFLIPPSDIHQTKKARC